MVDVRSEKKTIAIERRSHPRLELHCDASVPGLKGFQTLTDISFGGCFIEANIPGKIKLGQIITLNTKLPTEKNAIKVKAKIVNQRERGIGCQFISLQDDARDAICTCFEMYKDTLPAGKRGAQWENECLEKDPEVPSSGPIKDVTLSPLSDISNINQIKSDKSPNQHSMLLKVGVGLAVVLLTGYFLTKSIFHISPKTGPDSDTRYTGVATPQSHTIKIQAKSIESVDDNDEMEAQNVQSSKIKEDNTQSKAVGLTQGKKVSPTETEPKEIAGNPLVSDEKTSDVALKKTPDLESSGTYDHNLSNIGAETTANIPIKEIYTIEIGPIFSRHELKEATGILHDNGLGPEKIIETGTVKVIRLLEGSYSRGQAQERLKEIKKVADSAFLMPEKGMYSIYVATYFDHDKSIEKSKQLAKKNIHTTPVSAEIKMKGTKLYVKQLEQQNISAVQDQMSKLGMPIKILKSD